MEGVPSLRMFCKDSASLTVVSPVKPRLDEKDSRERLPLPSDIKPHLDRKESKVSPAERKLPHMEVKDSVVPKKVPTADEAERYELANDEPLAEPREVIAHSYDIKVQDNFNNSGKTEIHLWSLDRKSNSHLIRIQDFPIFCYMELPQFVDGRMVEWNTNSASRVIEYLIRALGQDAPTKWHFVMKPKVYYYRKDKEFPMVLMLFKTVGAMDHCRNLIAKPKKIGELGTLKLETLETSISIVRKIFSLRKSAVTGKSLRFSQWFRVQGQEVPYGHELRSSYTGGVECYGLPATPINEFVAKWDTLTPIEPEESKGWVTHPGKLSFDIETYSDNHRAMPNEFNAKHVAYMISCIYQRGTDLKTRRRFGIIRGDCNDIPGVEIIRVKDEVEEVSAMASLTQRLNPQIITGYNILSYDYPYLDVRLKTTKMTDWPQMGCLFNSKIEMKSKSWKSSAYGHNRINMLLMDGRISIDMLPIVRRDYKLDKYDLDSVCRHFLKKGKHPIKADEMFRIYERLEKAQAAYDTEKASPTNKRNLRNAVKELNEASKSKKEFVQDIQHRIEDATNRVKGEESKGDVSNEAVKELNEAKEAMTRVMAYCIQDSELVIDLFDKLNVWIGLVELSNIVGVTIVDLFTRGQQVRCLSQLYDLASKMGYVIDKRLAPKMFFNGGFVFEPVPGLYDNILVFDFASLYPSIMQAYNICFSTLIPKELEDQVPDSDCNIIDFEQDEPLSGQPKKRGKDDDEEGLLEGVNDEEKHVGDNDEKKVKKKKEEIVKRRYRFKWIKKEIREGVLPQLVRELIAERNQVKKQMKSLAAEVKLLEKLKKALDKPGTTISGFRLEVTQQIANEKKGSDEKKQTKNAVKETQERIKELEEWLKVMKTHENLDLTSLIATIELLLIVLDKRQNALKVSANSTFGFLGAQNGGMMPLIEGAMCITAIGRRLIGEVNDHLKKKHNAGIVYNDTDSSFVDLHIKDAKDCDAWGQRIMDEINGTSEIKLDDGTVKPATKGLFMAPLKMEFEKTVRLLLLKKKKYAMFFIDKDGKFKLDKETGEIEIGTKGIVLSRRDNTKMLKAMYTELLRLIMMKAPFHVAYACLIKWLCKLLRGQIDVRMLTVIRELGSDYKNQNYFMKVFADELRRMGKPVSPGDRIEYVFVRTQAELQGSEVATGMKMRSIEMWEDAWDAVKNPKRTSKLDVEGENGDTSPYPAEDIDVMYYIGHAFMNPIDQLFAVGYKDQLPKYESIGYKPEYSRCHYCSIASPVKMIGKLIADQLKRYNGYANTEPQKLSYIADTVEALPQWVKEQCDALDARIKAMAPKSRLDVSD
jgi:DNA polymerase elongation subunit (family B)